jgi:hypothetical protein
MRAKMKCICKKFINHQIKKCLLFLLDRKQRVKLATDCVSEWGAVPAGVPQGTKLGPWLFLWMINDLKITEVSTWKYVDDTTVSEVVKKRRYQQSPRRGYHIRKLVEFQQITS